VNEFVSKLELAAILEVREVLTNEDHPIHEEEHETFRDDEMIKDEISDVGAAAAEATYCALKAEEEDLEFSMNELSDLDSEYVSKIGRRAALQEYDRFIQEKYRRVKAGEVECVIATTEMNENITQLFDDVKAAAKEAAMKMFVKVIGDLEGDDALDVTTNDHETAVTNAGIQAAAAFYAQYIGDRGLYLEGGQNEKNSGSVIKPDEELREKLETVGYDAAKLEYDRMAAEAEDVRIKKDREANIMARVVEIARQAARSLYAVMAAEELEASGGDVIEVFDAERENIFKTEIANAGAETALVEFIEFVRSEKIDIPINEDSSRNIVGKSEEVDDETKVKVRQLGWEAAADEYELLKTQVERKLIGDEDKDANMEEEEDKLMTEEGDKLQDEEDVRRNRLREEEEARQREAEDIREEEEARIRLDEEARIREEEDVRLRDEEEIRLREEEEARLMAEEKDRLRKEEEDRLRQENETRIREEEEARLREEEEIRLKEEEEARLREEEARLREEEARLKAEEEARLRAEEEARLREEEEARLRAKEEARLRAEEEEIARIKKEELEKQAAIEAKLRAAEEERRRAEEEVERLKKEEKDRMEAEALEEMRRIQERQKAAAEARAKAREEDGAESPELLAFRKAQEDMWRALELSASEGLREEAQQSNTGAWLTFLLASLALYWALRILQDYVEEDHRDSMNMELQIKPYIYFEIKKWP